MRLAVFWEQQAARIASALDLKAVVDVTDAFDHEAETDALTHLLAALMLRLGEVGAWEVLAKYNPDAEGWSPEMIEAYLAKAAATNARRWSQAVADGLADTVAADPAEAPNRLRDFLASTGPLVLAATFIGGAVSFGAHDAAVKSGLGRKVWRTRGRNPRPSHAAQNGEEVAVHDVFSNGLRWPHDHFGSAAENANCRCAVEYLP